MNNRKTMIDIFDKIKHGLSKEKLGKIVKYAKPIGERVLNWMQISVNRFPKTFKMAAILGVLAFLVAQIPILGWLLFPVVHVVGLGIVLGVFAFELIGQIAHNHESKRRRLID